MGPACSKPPGDIATAAGVAQLPKIHGGAVLDAWCGGDNCVVTAGADGRVVLYDVAAGTAKTLGVHAAAANGVAAARDRAGAVYTCSRDLSVRRWPLARGPTQVIEAAHELAVTAVAVADDGATVASGSRDYRVKTWDAATGENAAAVRVPRNVVTCMCWRPTTQTFAQGSEDLRLRVWDARDLRQAAAQTFAGYEFFPLAVASAGPHLITASKGFGGEGGEVTLWDARRPGSEPLAVLRGHAQDATGVAFLRGGAGAASASKDGRVKLWDLEAGTLSRDVDVGGESPMYTSVCAAPGAATVAAVATTFQGDVFCFDREFRVAAAVG